MTTGVARSATVFIPYRRDFSDDFYYPDPDPKRPESMLQAPVVEECGHILRNHFSGQPYAHIDTGADVYYNRQDRIRGKIGPDLYIAFGVEAGEVLRRRNYLVWEAGKPPDFALEVASESTHAVDTDSKPGIYARIGVGEYWRFDSTGGDLYGYPLAGDLLVDGVYRPIGLVTEPDGMVWGYSPALDLCLCAEGRRLRFYDRKTGSYLRNLAEEQAAHRRTEEELQAARRRTEEEHRQEQAARRRVEDELQAALAELERLRGDGEGRQQSP